MPRRDRPPRIAVILDPAHPMTRGLFAGILDHARPRGWRLGDESALGQADGVICDAHAIGVTAKRVVTVSVTPDANADVCPDAARVRALAAEHFRQRGFGDFITDTAGLDVSALARPAACLGATDAAAADVIRRATAAGRPVPGELAVLGVGNDVLTCERSDPPLSSIDLGPRRIGRLAAERLSKLLLGRDPGGPAGVPPVGVVERASTDTLAVDDPQVVVAVRFIRENAGGPLRVGDILRASGLDRRTLERRFARHFGRSPAEAVRRARVDAAAKLLCGTTLPMTAVAEASGFRLPQHLAAAFKAVVGTTPTDYRASMSGGSDDSDV